MKIYIHHYYTYELFWYFFHGAKLEENIPTWFIGVNQYNKNIKVDNDVNIKFQYNDINFEAIFCSNSYWDKLDGYHVFDYNIYHIENKNISDRGWNVLLGDDLSTTIIPMLNKHSKKLNNLISFFYIDWEFSGQGQSYILETKLNPFINLFIDELHVVSSNQKISFTHVLFSYLMPNTIGLRDYYYFADYIKYKNDYKYKINFPIRRVSGGKTKIQSIITNLNNPNINCTISSFTDYYNHSRSNDNQVNIKNKIVSNIGKDNIIQKRGYNLNDFGGEWNDNNMNEFMWKLMTISDVNILFEKTDGNGINEKSLGHILAAKPFLPSHFKVFNYYKEILEKYGYVMPEYPLKYNIITEILPYLDEVTYSESDWNELRNKLQIFVNTLRSNLIEIIHNNNGYLDFLIYLNHKSSNKEII